MEILRTPASRAPLFVVASLAAAVFSGACDRSQSPARGTPEAPGAAPRLELGASLELDSGNSAYKAKDYAGALAHYRNAAEREPTLAAAWFGIYMAQTALGNAAGADSAMRRVQTLAPGTMGAHPAAGTGVGGAAGTGDAAAPLPPGHPALPAKPDR